MHIVEKIEYYSHCPSCGAQRPENKEICEYCGSSLIKSRSSSEYFGDDLTDRYLEEDSGLAEIKGTLCAKGSQMLFWWLFGGMFFAVPTIMFFALLAEEGAPLSPVWFLCIFWFIGIAALSVPIRSAVNLRKCMNGPRLEGIVRGYENGSFMINDAPVQNIRIRTVKDGQDVILILGTGQTNKKFAVGSRIAMRNYNNCYSIDQG